MQAISWCHNYSTFHILLKSQNIGQESNYKNNNTSIMDVKSISVKQKAFSVITEGLPFSDK